MAEASELVKHDPGTMARREDAAPTPLEMIASIARDPSIPIDRISALVGLQERMEAREAEREFNRDFAAAMLEMPRVAKKGRKDMGSKGCIAYETFEDLDAAVRPIETRHGFARTFLMRPADKPGCIMTLRLTHRAGHSMISERFCPPDPGPGRNDIQAAGSGESYGRRYLTKAIWNIVTVGADDDAHTADPITQEQADELQDWLNYLAFTPPQLAKFWAWVWNTAEPTPDQKHVGMIQRRDHERIASWLRGQAKAKEGGKK